MEKTEERKLQDCSARCSTEIKKLKEEMQGQKEAKDKDDDDYDDERPSVGISSPEKHSDTLLSDVKVSLQDATQLLQSCEEHKTRYKGAYKKLITRVGDVTNLGEDNFICVKHICDSIRDIKDEKKKIFNPKLKRLHDLKKYLDGCQVAQVEELYKWNTVLNKQLSDVEKLLSSLLNQGNQVR